jgi:hypothetical protein
VTSVPDLYDGPRAALFDNGGPLAWWPTVTPLDVEDTLWLALLKERNPGSWVVEVPTEDFIHFEIYT